MQIFLGGIKLKTLILVMVVLVIFAPILVPVMYSCNFYKNSSGQAIKCPTLQDSVRVTKKLSKQVIYGKSSWYGKAFDGRMMANGNTFNMYDPTIVAHKTLPFGTKLRVQNLTNGKSVECFVQDRGPYVKGRTIDLSYAAAKIIGIDKSGVENVKIEVFQKG